MVVEIHILIGSISILVLALFLAISQYRERASVSSLINLKSKLEKEERRTHPRYETSLRIKYKTHSEEGVSWIKDISRSGARLFSVNPFEPGTILEIEINLPHDSKPIVAQGNIVWMQKDDAALSFDEIEPGDLNRILQYIGHRKQINLLKV